MTFLHLDVYRRLDQLIINWISPLNGVRGKS
jgi:hypothetical protein